MDTVAKSLLKRRRLSSNRTSIGKKRCTCMNTNCLKLYCVCFKAGLYCAESCTCQECFNNHDYEDSVEIAREQIQLQDPHAFSPFLIMKCPTSQNEDENQAIPFELKNRKGCKCRSLMCMKNYCACYQAKVGCGSECRCVSCKNSFGKKGEAGRKAESSNPQIQHLDRREGASTTSHFTRNGNSDMVSLDQQTYHNAEIMNQFTPPNTTMLGRSIVMNRSKSSRTNENITYVDSVVVTSIPLFGGTQVNNSHGNPVDTSDKNTPNTPSGSWMHHPNAYRQQ